MSVFSQNFNPKNSLLNIQFLVKWLFISLIMGLLIGLMSAFFLITLEWVTHFREANHFLIWCLPLGGFLVGWVYYQWGQSVSAGNNLIIERIHHPEREKIPFKMAPMVYVGTMLTHLFGGSAGREGTALQMAAAIADQLKRWFGLDVYNRKILLIAAVAAGFGAVFGTPLAGVLFALEFCVIGKVSYRALLPALLSAIVAHYVCTVVGAHHTHYEIPFVPDWKPVYLLYTILVGLFCALAAKIFSESMHLLSRIYAKFITYAPFRPLIGGLLVAILIFVFSAYKYAGLGVPTIQAAFNQELPAYTFVLKILFTVLTLSAGFKGGEVTPLFFIGATLGNALAYFIPMPMPLLAGICFVAVFAGATHTPLACTLMAIELFGADCALYVAVACIVAHIFSGKSTIYLSQLIEKEL